MGENTLTDGIGELLATELAATDDVYVVRPTRETIEEVVVALSDLAGPSTVRLLAAERPLKEVMDDFIVASRAADLVADGRLELRTTADPTGNSLLVTATEVVAVVPAGGQVAGLRTDDGAFLERAHEKYAAAWADADEFDLRTPPLTDVRRTLAADIGESAAADFDTVLDSAGAVKSNGSGLDEVTISLLVAAKNGELLYDISKWGEDVGLASKATFSRTKTRLEDAGLIETEKVPIDVGRPRLRLIPGDEALADTDAAELASTARQLLSN